MRFSLVLLFAASVVSAVSVFKRHNDIQLPECAKQCVKKTDPSPCKYDDTACLCVNYKYQKTIAECVEECCGPDDVKAAAEAGIAYCKAVGIDPENPFPQCAETCIKKIPSECSYDDDCCLCKDDKYLEGVIHCFKEHCKGDDYKNAACTGEAYCRAAGVDISSIFGYW
ncbi:hypothetical protein FRB90_011704 [Tulasnella sp. 427]|nr:hypothetical protein FRB90_011704 [Tulasnella sp. 427]